MRFAVERIFSMKSNALSPTYLIERLHMFRFLQFIWRHIFSWNYWYVQEWHIRWTAGFFCGYCEWEKVRKRSLIRFVFDCCEAVTKKVQWFFSFKKRICLSIGPVWSFQNGVLHKEYAYDRGGLRCAWEYLRPHKS
jgi:hypothetical protein